MARKTERSSSLYERASRVLPGGVDSPVRSFRSVGAAPFFVQSASGSTITDVDGNRYIDYVMSWGPLIAGHAHPDVIARIREQAGSGTSYGAPVDLEVELAETVIQMVPSIEKIRFVSSGTEAAMSALRVARGFTKRNRVVKCDGCYHGHADPFLVKAGSGLATQGLADSAGVPPEVAAGTTVVPFNDLAAVEAALLADPAGYAAVIVEPIAANMGLVPPAAGYLEGLRRVADRYGVLLIFDEVISGFRAAPGGAQEMYGVRPDLTVLGKIIGGGLPVGAYGGRRDIMSLVAPEGPVYQAGTLSGNPLAMAAGLAMLRLLSDGSPYRELDAKGRRLLAGLEAAAREAGVTVTIHQLGSLLTVFFAGGSIGNYADAARSDRARFGSFHRAMLERGVFLPPSQFEAWFLSTAHSEEDLDRTIEAARESFRATS